MRSTNRSSILCTQEFLVGSNSNLASHKTIGDLFWLAKMSQYIILLLRSWIFLWVGGIPRRTIYTSGSQFKLHIHFSSVRLLIMNTNRKTYSSHLWLNVRCGIFMRNFLSSFFSEINEESIELGKVFNLLSLSLTADYYSDDKAC